MSLPIYGLSFLRNGIKYDYPFRECLLSLAGICQDIELALGDSDDGTEKALADLPKLHILPTIWDENLRKGGQILSQQTNLALENLRKRVGKGWVICLQADEILSDQEYNDLRRDLNQAELEGCDAISFRYLHFWKSYEAIAYEWRWYAHEIRAFRIDSFIESYGDAQSFRGWQKKYESNVHIFHYGHVRDASAYEKKKTEFHRWWHSDADMQKVIEKGARRDPAEPVLRYLGPHPTVMRSRLPARISKRTTLVVFGRREDYSEEFLNRVNAELHFTLKESEIPTINSAGVVFLQCPSFWFRVKNFAFWIREPSIPKQVKSPQAKKWTKEFYALMALGAKGVSVRGSAEC